MNTVLLGALAVLSVLNLMATGMVLKRSWGTARRDRVAGEYPPPHLAHLIGHEPSEFVATGVDDREIATADLHNRPWLLGFFSTGCAPCHERAPEFAALARETPDSIAVVTGGGAERNDLVGLLDGSSIVLVDAAAATVVRAFGIDAFPTLVQTQDGRILQAGVAVEHLRSLSST